MKNSDQQLERLLRAAACAPVTPPAEMPLGFDTRVLARSGERRNGEVVAIGRLLRRVVLLSLGVILLAGSGFYRELRQSDDVATPLTDEYAIADNAIGDFFEP
jgi:hypothetical protein